MVLLMLDINVTKEFVIEIILNQVKLNFSKFRAWTLQDYRRCGENS